MEDIRFAYVQNRSEENRRDIWGEFIVPTYFDTLEIRRQRKAVVIEGSRGCGKTTLLRYLSYHSQFSPSRGSLEPKDIEFIGIYWKLDVNFLSAFVSDELTEAQWIRAFKHYLAVYLGQEILASIEAINCTKERLAVFGGVNSLDLSELRSFDDSLPGDLNSLKKELQRKRDQFTMWLNNIGSSSGETLDMLPGEHFLQRLVQVLTQQLGYLGNSRFSVFIDEYENLPDYQQRYVNGLMKSAESPLLFNVAMKPNGMRTNRTLTTELIQNVADYRLVQLEDELRDSFEAFAAELLFFRLIETRPDLAAQTPISPDELRSEDHLRERRDQSYRRKLQDVAGQILPRMSDADLAVRILNTPEIERRLARQISIALQQQSSRLTADDFIRKSAPEASIVCSALLSRRKERPEAILEALERFTSNGTGPFKDWIANNLFGVEMQLYLPLGTACPLYSGFDALVLMSRLNVRYFLELVHQIFRDNVAADIRELPSIEPEAQARSIYAASSLMVEQVHAFGSRATELHTFVTSMGSLLRARQSLAEQSEPEATQFTVSKGAADSELDELLLEAEKWSVVIVASETKAKNTHALSYEYLLHPAFSANFGISYRKKRSVSLSADQLKTLFLGGKAQRDSIVQLFGKVKSSGTGDLFGSEDGDE